MHKDQANFNWVKSKKLLLYINFNFRNLLRNTTGVHHQYHVFICYTKLFI
jgi:hypothetical protein